jgi:hypothetical protein
MLSNDYKSSVRAEGGLDDKMLEQLLVAPRPRFVWRAILKCQEESWMELLFDATDFSRSLPLNLAVWHNKEFARKLKKLLAAPQIRAILAQITTDRFWEFLEKSIDEDIARP